MKRTVLSLLALLALVVTPLARAAETPLPPQGSPPPGANNFSCKPPAKHPFPIVLVHGTFGNQTVSWNRLSPDLTRLGYCVFALDYGNSPGNQIDGVGDIPTSAAQLRTFVLKVLRATHAKKVSIVGHSQGGMMPRYFVKFLGGAALVDDLVGLSPSSHGTTVPAAAIPNPNCPACNQQAVGSSFLRKLNAGDQTPGPVQYSVIETSHDEVVTPYQSEALPGPASRVTNVVPLQKYCPADPVDHVGIIYDPIALQFALNALGRPGPLDPKFRPNCTNLTADQTFPNSSSVVTAHTSPAHPRGAPRPVVRVLSAHRSGRHRLVVLFRVRNATVRVRVLARRLGTGVVRHTKVIRVRGVRRVTFVSRGHFARGRYAVRVIGRATSGRKIYTRRVIRVR